MGYVAVLTKAAETLRVFANNAPSLRALARGRRRQFDDAEIVVQSRTVVGESREVTVSLWDEYLRPVPDFSGTFAVDSTDSAASHPDSLRVGADDDPVQTLQAVFETPGIQYLTLTREETGRRYVSNPVQVFESEPGYRLYWGDIHLHSQYSDGAGTMTRGYEFGRDVMALDVAAYTDHDTMGFFIPPKLQRRRMHRRYFEQILRVTDHHNQPGEFVTLPGYEWTKQPNMGGHINVYFEDSDDAELFDSLDPETNRYEKLWRRLEQWQAEHDSDVLTIPHHTAEKMYPFDFSAIDYDDELAPLVEVYSQWGSSEQAGADGNPRPIAMGQGEMDEPGHYVQDALAMGHRVGLMGSSDFHAPRPGLSNIHLPPHLPSFDDIWRDGVGWGHIWRIWEEGSYPGGLTGFYASELTREAVFDSLQSRRVYATSQPHRILVEFAVDGTGFGASDGVVTADGDRTISYLVAGTAPIERVTVVKNNSEWHVAERTTDVDLEPGTTATTDSERGTADGEHGATAGPLATTGADLDAYTMERTVTDDDPVTGMGWDDDRGSDADVYYLRVEQVDDGIAWAGPVWVEPGE